MKNLILANYYTLHKTIQINTSRETLEKLSFYLENIKPEEYTEKGYKNIMSLCLDINNILLETIKIDLADQKQLIKELKEKHRNL